MFPKTFSWRRWSMSSTLTITSPAGASRLFSTTTVGWAAAQRAPRTRKQSIAKAVKTGAVSHSTESSGKVLHEDAFTVQRTSAKDAFHALFAQKKAAAALAQETDASPGDHGGKAEEDNEELRLAEEERGASHGEEELAEMRDDVRATAADDMDCAEEATAPLAQPPHVARTTQTKDKDGDDDEENENENENEGDCHERAAALHVKPRVNQPLANELTDILGQAYVGEVAEAIHHFAEGKHFESGVWASRFSFQENDVKVTVDDEEGALIHIGGRSIVLFNLDQTDYQGPAAQASVLSDLRSRGRKFNKASARKHAPLDLRGLLLSSKHRADIMSSPLFNELQSKASLWVNLFEMRSLGAEVRPEEKQRYCYSEAEAPFTPPPAAMRAWMEESFPDLDINTLERGKVFYNISQLADEARFKPYYHSQAYFTPRSWTGRRYSAGYAFLLREYCTRYGFPLDDAYVIFVPIGRIRSHGGAVLETPRGTPTGPAVPPPFTLIMNDESIVSLYNALQTDIAELLIANAKERATDIVKRYHSQPKRYITDFAATTSETREEEEH